MADIRCRTALVNPPDTVGFVTDPEGAMPPLGLAYVAAVMRADGLVADLFDLAEHQPSRLGELEETGFFGYDVYGLTAYTKCFEGALAVVDAVRERNPHAIVVFGGPHATPSAEAILRQYPHIDAVVCGEGEYALRDLVHHVTNPNEHAIATVPNLFYREGGLDYRRSGQSGDVTRPVMRSEVSRWEKDLDALPHPIRDYVVEPSRFSTRFARDGRRVREIHVCSSRGCPKRCTFCSIVVASPNYRVRTVGSLMREIRELYDREAFGHVYFTDANFAVSSKRTLEFAETLYAWRPEVTWSGTATADLIMRHADVLERVGRLNCVYLEIGIESGSPAQLQRYNKRTSIDDNRNAIALLQRSGIALGLDFIMFDPEVNIGEIRENFEFLRECELFGTSPPQCLFNGLRLYPGTPARERYLAMFGLADDHLAHVQPMFLDPKIGELYRVATNYFSVIQTPLTGAQLRLQVYWREVMESGRNPSEAQAAAALLIELQHEAYRFFEALLEMFEQPTMPSPSDLRNLTVAFGRRAASLVRRSMHLIEGAYEPELPEEGAVRLAGMRSAEHHGSVYLLPLNGRPLRLNASGSFLWQRIGSTRDAVGACTGYAKKFGKTSSEALREVVTFVDFLSRHTGVPAEEFLTLTSAR